MGIFCKSIYLTIGLFLLVGQANSVESIETIPRVQGPENFAQKPSEIPLSMSVVSPDSDSIAGQGNNSSQGQKLTDLENKVFTIESDLQEFKNKVDLLEALNSKVDSLAADVGSLKISGTSVDGKTTTEKSGSTPNDGTLPAKPARFAATTDQGSTPTTSNSSTSAPEQSDQAVVAPASDNPQKPEDSMGFGSSVFEVKSSPVDAGVSPMNLDLTSTPTITNETSLLESQSVIKSDALPI